MDALQVITLALGASWASGINLYATVLVLGVLNLLGIFDMPENLLVLGNYWVLGTAFLLYVVEFFADKIPGVDSLWDVIHTFIRIPAGALIAAGAVDGLDIGLGGEMETVIGLVLGGTVAGGTHAAKAASRAVINISPEPFSNWFASISEDILAIVGISVALFYPLVFLIGLGLFVYLAVRFSPKLGHGIRLFLSGFRHPVETARVRSEKGTSMPLSLRPPKVD